MMRTCYFILLLLCSALTQAQTPWRAKLFAHFLDSNNKTITDTVWFGCDNLADEGYQPGIDVLDTTIASSKILAYDSLVQVQFKTRCVNLKHNIKAFKKGEIEFKFQMFGRPYAISWDTADFNFNENPYEITEAEVSSSHAYLFAVDRTRPIEIFSFIEEDSSRVFYHDSIRVIREGRLFLCDEKIPSTNLKLTVWMGVLYNGDHEQILPQYKVFPNPVNSAIHIQFEKVSTGTFKLYNQLGVEVMSSSVHQNNECAIPTQYLDEGLYFLTWIDDTKIKHKAQKILIKH